MLNFTLTTPIWLWLLVPWGLLVLWVLVARSEVAIVTTTQFWDTFQQTQSTRRSFKRPPTGFVLLLLSMLLAILSASGLWWGNPSQGQRFTLIVDRNIGSFVAMQNDLASLLDRLRSISGENAQFDLVTAPDRKIEDVSIHDSRAKLESMKPTAIDSSAAINQTITSELTRTQQAVYLISSQAILVTNPRLHQLSANYKIQNAGIDQFSLTLGEKTQALVKVWNGSDIKQAILQVDDQTQSIELPARGGWREYYFVLPNLETTSTAKLLIEDDVAADNVAYLSRRGVWPKLVAENGLAEGLQRMIEVYSRKRAADANAKKVYVVTSLNGLPKDPPALIVPPCSDATTGKIELNPNERLANIVNWDAVLKNAKTASPVGEGWIDIVKLNGKPIVARRESPANQIWVGIDSPVWALRTDYVIFFTDVFDFLGNASKAYTAEPAHELDRAWSPTSQLADKNVESSPGIYKTPEGLVAMNMAVFQAASTEDVTQAEITPRESKKAYNLSRPTMIVAMLLALSGVYCLTRTRDRLA